MIEIARSLADVYRICKQCWRSTKHEIFTDEVKGTMTYRCVERGFNWKEKENDG